MELGVMVVIRDETDPAEAFERALAAGYSRGQVSFQIRGLTPEKVRLVALASHAARFTVDAVGCYFNPLRPDDPGLSSVNFADWKTLAENMAMLNGVERIVCWSGTLAKTLGTPNLLNQEESTFNNLFIALSGYFERLRGMPLQILVEPYTAHVIHDTASCLRLAAKFPGGEVKVVLDAVNLLTLRELAGSDAGWDDFVRKIAPAVGLVHLKDVSADADGHRVFLPPGKGRIDYGRFLRAVANSVPAVPIIVEQTQTVEEMREARTSLEAVMKEIGL